MDWTEIGKAVGVLATVAGFAAWVWRQAQQRWEKRRAVVDVSFDRVNPNNIDVVISNAGPAAATDVQIRFPDKPPIFKKLDGTKPFPLLSAGKKFKLHAIQYLEHTLDDVYAVEVEWFDRKHHRKLFHLPRP